MSKRIVKISFGDIIDIVFLNNKKYERYKKEVIEDIKNYKYEGLYLYRLKKD